MLFFMYKSISIYYKKRGDMVLCRLPPVSDISLSVKIMYKPLENTFLDRGIRLEVVRTAHL